jgi:hypothetical protein
MTAQPAVDEPLAPEVQAEVAAERRPARTLGDVIASSPRLAEIMARVEADVAAGRLTPIAEDIDSPTAIRREVIADRVARWREGWAAHMPKRYEGADLATLKDGQDPRGMVTGWLDSGHLGLGLVGPAGRGKCVDADSVVYDPSTGVPARIGDVVDAGEDRSTWTLAREREIVTVPITAMIDSGWKPTVRVTTASGRSIIVTPHHPFLLPDGWRKAEDVEVGETIALPARVPLPSEPVAMADSEIDLLALLIAEGCTNLTSAGPRNVTFSTGDPLMVERADGAARDLGMTVRKVPTATYDYALLGTMAVPGKRCPRAIAREFVQGHRIQCLAKHKRIPEAVYRLDEAGLRRFLSVFWMCDGYVESSGRAGLAMASEGLVRDIQHLLLRLGVQSSVQYAAKTSGGKTFDAWRLHVLSQSAEAFATLDLWGEKGQRAKVGAASTGTPNTGLPTVTGSIRQAVAAITPKPPSISRMAFTNPSKARPTVIRRTASWLAEQDDQWARLAAPDVYWDRVVSVENAGERHVYDLSVDETANFIANDVIVHNTHVLAALGYSALDHAVKPLLITMADLNDAMRPGGDRTLYDKAATCDVLLLDDIGRERITEWTLEQTQRLLDARSRHARRTAWSTNLNSGDLTARYGEPIMQRLMDDTLVANFSGVTEVMRAPASW